MKTKKKYAWKIFTKDDKGELYSINKRYPNAVKYHKKEWNMASIGGLLVFKSRSAARTFKQFGTFWWETVVKKVEVTEQIELPEYRARLSAFMDDEAIMKAIKNCWNNAYDENYSTWPLATEAYKYVRIVGKG